jgi:hypothetical protein
MTSPIGVVVLIVLVAVVLLQLPVLAGGLTGLGVTWLTLTISRFVECDPTDSFCGEANYVPLPAVSSLLAFVGVILGAVSIRRATYDND